MFRSLKYRNFRLFFVGQFLSLCGTWIQSTAQAWLVYRLTKDPMLLGMVAFVGQFPVFLLGFYSGSVIDRMDHFEIIIGTQVLALIQAAILALLTLSGVVQVWHVFALAFMMGVVNAFDVPVRQVLIGELVEPADRHNAIALNSTIVNGSRIIGPAIAGLLIAGMGEGTCFAINALSYLCVIVALLMMREVRQPEAASHGTLWDEIGKGLSYVMGQEPIRALLSLLMAFSLASLPVYVFMPIYAEDILHSGAKGFGILSSFSGLGATAGALLLAWRKNSAGLGLIIVRCILLFGVSIGGLAFSRNFGLSCALLWFIGFAAIQILAGANTLLQELSNDRFRGRVMGFYSMIFIGLAPVGSYAIGSLASRIGVTTTTAVEAVICLLIGAAYYRRLPAVLALRP